MKFVQNNKILEDSNAESAEISAEKQKPVGRKERDSRTPHTIRGDDSPSWAFS